MVTTSDPLSEYLHRITPTAVPAAAPLVRELHSVITRTAPELVAAVRYGILMYALPGERRFWVVALDAGKASVAIRFLYGVILDDPLAVLRKGSSVLMTWDIPYGTAVDQANVAAYVGDAVAKHSTYRTDWREITARAKNTSRGDSGGTPTDVPRGDR